MQLLVVILLCVYVLPIQNCLSTKMETLLVSIAVQQITPKPSSLKHILSYVVLEGQASSSDSAAWLVQCVSWGFSQVASQGSSHLKSLPGLEDTPALVPHLLEVLILYHVSLYTGILMTVQLPRNLNC